MANLTPKQLTFIDEYMVDMNATQAARRAGYSAKTAHRTGAENLQKPAIKNEIQRRMDERGERTGITADRVLQEAGRLGLFDARRLFESDGTPKPIHELDDDTAAAIAGVEVVTIGNSDVGVGQVIKYRIADKNSALEKLFKHHGLYERDNSQSAAGLADAIVKARRRAKENGDG